MTTASALLRPAPGPTTEVLGVRVREGEVPKPWDAEIQSEHFVADADRFLQWNEHAAVYVAHGDEVVMEARSPRHRLAHDYLVYARASRVLLWQRRRFSLHATMAVSPSGVAIAITGESMAGKSMTTAELVRRGWTFVCDDVLEVEVRDDRAVAIPFRRPVHLSDRAAELLGANPHEGRVLLDRGKRVFDMSGDLHQRALSGLVRLRIGESDQVDLEPLSPLDSLPVVAHHSDPVGVCQLPELRGDYMRWTADLVSTLRAADLSRPVDSWSVDDVAHAIEHWVMA